MLNTVNNNRLTPVVMSFPNNIKVSKTFISLEYDDLNLERVCTNSLSH